MSSGTTALDFLNVDRNAAVTAASTGAFASMRQDSDFLGKKFVDIPLFPGDFVLLYMSFLLFMKTWRLVFPKPVEAVTVPVSSPARPLVGGMSDRSGVIDLFTGMKVVGLIVLFSFVLVFLSNMATTFSVYLSPVLAMIAFPFKAL